MRQTHIGMPADSGSRKLNLKKFRRTFTSWD